MKWKYKIVMFLTLLIFCVGSVCAVEPDNNTTVNNGPVINDLSNLNYTVNNTDSVINGTLNNSNNSKIDYDNKMSVFIKKFKERNNYKPVGDITFDLINRSQSPEKIKNYYAVRLNKLSSNIKNAFDTIDNNINKDFNKLFKNLEVNMNLLNKTICENKLSNNLSDNNKTIKIVDNLIKNVEKGLLSFKSYNNTLNYYLDSLEQYTNLSNLINNDSKNYIDINNSEKELELRINDLSILYNLFSSIEDNLKYIKYNTNLMIKVLKEEKRYYKNIF